MKTIIAKAGASGTQTRRMGDLQGVATSSAAQNAAVWGETAMQTYTINDNIVYRHAINNANARAKGVQTIAQVQKFNKTNTKFTKQTRKHYKANARGEGYSLSLSLSLSFSRAFFKTYFNTQNFKTHIQENSRKIHKFRQIFQIFTQKFTNFANSLIKFKDFKFLWIASAFSTPRNDEWAANFLSTPRNDGVGANSQIFSKKFTNFTNFLIKFKNFIFLWIASTCFRKSRNDGVGANSRIYSSFAIARNDEQAGKFAAPYLKRREFTTPYICKARNYNLSYSFPCFSVSAN